MDWNIFYKQNNNVFFWTNSAINDWNARGLCPFWLHHHVWVAKPSPAWPCRNTAADFFWEPSWLHTFSRTGLGRSAKCGTLRCETHVSVCVCQLLFLHKHFVKGSCLTRGCALLAWFGQLMLHFATMQENSLDSGTYVIFYVCASAWFE